MFEDAWVELKGQFIGWNACSLVAVGSSDARSERTARAVWFSPAAAHTYLSASPGAVETLTNHLSNLLRRLTRDVDPAWVALARDLHAHGRVEGMLVDAVVAVAHDGAVDIS
jgi:hypothetical protein